ncbi:hypothetical protein E2C01_004303 [Portunus trituberculatus]|uniref:Uncharacterized protein n=1 Tax=Portunus trituberculatus TaxID=210409 RepID=A0A5B7CPL5_PORTR|nr:hypothetical protein [Portunus trituberculatus]
MWTLKWYVLLIKHNKPLKYTIQAQTYMTPHLQQEKLQHLGTVELSGQIPEAPHLAWLVSVSTERSFHYLTAGPLILPYISASCGDRYIEYVSLFVNAHVSATYRRVDLTQASYTKKLAIICHAAATLTFTALSAPNVTPHIKILTSSEELTTVPPVPLLEANN